MNLKREQAILRCLFPFADAEWLVSGSDSESDESDADSESTSSSLRDFIVPDGEVDYLSDQHDRLCDSPADDGLKAVIARAYFCGSWCTH